MTDPQTAELFFSLLFKDRNVVENTQERFRLAQKSAVLRGFIAAGYVRLGALFVSGARGASAKSKTKGAKGAKGRLAKNKSKSANAAMASPSSIPFEQRAEKAREILRDIAEAKKEIVRVQDEQSLRAIAAEALTRAALVHAQEAGERAQATEAMAATLREYVAGASDARKAAIRHTFASLNEELSKLPRIPTSEDPHALMVASGDLIHLVRAHIEAGRIIK
ncbi:MAG: hypothetical protein V1728_04150 [Candidatus Micrarchaeota archaeon]